MHPLRRFVVSVADFLLSPFRSRTSFVVDLDTLFIELEQESSKLVRKHIHGSVDHVQEVDDAQ